MKKARLLGDRLADEKALEIGNILLFDEALHSRQARANRGPIWLRELLMARVQTAITISVGLEIRRLGNRSADSTIAGDERAALPDTDIYGRDYVAMRTSTLTCRFHRIFTGKAASIPLRRRQRLHDLLERRQRLATGGVGGERRIARRVEQRRMRLAAEAQSRRRPRCRHGRCDRRTSTASSPRRVPSPAPQARRRSAPGNARPRVPASPCAARARKEADRLVAEPRRQRTDPQRASPPVAIRRDQRLVRPASSSR